MAHFPFSQGALPVGYRPLPPPPPPLPSVNGTLSPDLLTRACKTGDIGLVRLAIQNHAKPDKQTLTWAYASKNMEMIEIVSRAGALPDDETLPVACASQNLALVQKALSQKARVNYGALKIVFRSGNHKLREAVLKALGPNILNLSDFCKTGDMRQVRTGIEKCALTDDETLTWACKSGNYEILEAVAKLDPRPDSETLTTACATGQTVFVVKVLALGAIPNLDTQRIAIETGNNDILRAIYCHGRLNSPHFMNLRNGQRNHQYEQTLIEGINRYRSSVAPWCYLAQELQANEGIVVGQDSEARQYDKVTLFRQAHLIDPKSPLPFIGLAGALQGPYQAIEMHDGTSMLPKQLCEMAISLEPGLLSAYHVLANILAEGEKASLPNDLSVTKQELLILALEWYKDSESSEKYLLYYDLALTLPGLDSSYSAYGITWTQRELLLKAIENNPEFSLAYYVLGHLLPPNQTVMVNEWPLSKQDLYKSALTYNFPCPSLINKELDEVNWDGPPNAGWT